MVHAPAAPRSSTARSASELATVPRIYSGTSGWVYQGWRAHLYADTPIKQWLRVASTAFSSLEINGSFYVRLHGHTRKYASSYSGPSLRRWAGDARRWRDEGRDVFVYFDNDAEGHAVRNARAFARLIDDARAG